MCGVQYVYQWFDQFVRDGNGLEVSYYWSFAYPTFAIALALLLGRLTTNARSMTLYLLLGGWIAMLIVGIPGALRLPAGLGFFLVAVIAVGALAAVATRSSTLTAAGLVLVVGWTQIGAPTYDPTSYFEINVSPRYDQLYRKAGAPSEVIYAEAVWFAEQMDRIPNDASTSFVPVGGWSTSIVGLYAPHPISRIVPMEVERNRLSPVGIKEIRSGMRPIVAVYGPPQDVATMIDSFADDLGVGSRLADSTHESALGYRLVVYAMPDSTRLPFTWPAASLPRVTGEVKRNSITVSPPAKPGIVTFGPYITLSEGSYVVTLRYASAADTNIPVGALDVVNFGGPPKATAALSGTLGKELSVRLRFEIDDPDGKWEFRTSWLGGAEFTVASIELANEED